MLNITEEQRDRLLDLCKTSKSVSSDYDKATEIVNDIDLLPEYIREQFSYKNSNDFWDNLDEKLMDINNYLNEIIWNTK